MPIPHSYSSEYKTAKFAKLMLKVVIQCRLTVIALFLINVSAYIL